MARRREAGAEWMGGIVSLPAFVTGEGEPYQPELLLWVGENGDLLGFDVSKPADTLAGAARVLRTAMERPMAGKPRKPARVRVSSEPLARALRAELPDLAVDCGPTPQFDAAASQLAAHLAQQFAQLPEEQSYLENDVAPDAVGAFFRAMAGLFRAAPWKHVPGDVFLLSVSIPALEIEDHAISVIGQMGESHGLIVFRSIDDFEAYLDAACEGSRPHTLPGHSSLNFDRGGDLPPSLRKEIAAHRWEVAGPTAYPRFMVVESGLVGRAPTTKELRAAEALALALPRLLAEKEALAEAWWAAEPMTRTFSVATHGGPVEVTLRAPHEGSPHREGEGEGDEGAGVLSEEDEEIFDRFFSSPEGRRFEDGVDACRSAMDIAGERFGVPLTELEASELDELVFDVMPEVFDRRPDDATAIVEELRAFYRFAEREALILRVKDHLDVLGSGAVRRLEEGLGDAERFGIAKTVIMAGRVAGFDVDTPEGLAAWLEEMKREARQSPLDVAARLRGEKKKTKQKRKAARKAPRKRR